MVASTSWKSPIHPFLLLGLLVTTGCNGEDIQDVATKHGGKTVAVSGTLSNPSWLGGQYLMGVFPAAITPGPTGAIGGGAFPGAAAISFSVQVPQYAGSAYIFAFEDANADGVPAVSEPQACSTSFVVGATAVSGVTINLNNNIPPDFCP